MTIFEISMIIAEICALLLMLFAIGWDVKEQRNLWYGDTTKVDKFKRVVGFICGLIAIVWFLFTVIFQKENYLLHGTVWACNCIIWGYK